MIPVYSKFIDCFVFHRNEEKFEFLLLFRSEGHLYPKTWQNIQGKIENDEKAYDAALREVREETGIEPVNIWNLDYQNIYYYPKTNEMYIFPVFVAEAKTKDIKLSGEHEKFGWFDLNEAVQKVIWKSQKQSLLQIHDEFHINPNPQKLEFTKL